MNEEKRAETLLACWLVMSQTAEGRVLAIKQIVMRDAQIAKDARMNALVEAEMAITAEFESDEDISALDVIAKLKREP